MTSSRSTAGGATRLPRYRRADIAPPMVLTHRDEQILRWVGELRFVTQEQLQALLFSASTKSSCKRRLTLLYHNRYLDRRLLPLRSAFGANRAVYCLDRRGAEFLTFQGEGNLDWRRADNDRELYFLQHTIDTNEIAICATLAARREGFDFAWTGERVLKRRAMRDSVVDPKHPDHKLTVIPDGYFRIAGRTSPLGFAVELDRGTVQEKPFKAKIRGLGEWKTTGVYRQRFGTDSLRVLFVVSPNRHDARRLERIKNWTEVEGGRSLFWFASLSDLTPQTIFQEPIWHVAGRTDRAPLFAGATHAYPERL